MAGSTATTTATVTGTETTLRSGTVIIRTAATGTAAAPGAAAVATIATSGGGGGGGSGGGGAGGAGGAPVGGGVPVPFALEPAALDNAPLNYATKAGLN